MSVPHKPLFPVRTGMIDNKTPHPELAPTCGTNGYRSSYLSPLSDLASIVGTPATRVELNGVLHDKRWASCSHIH
jgi:hypothetical protein